MQQTQQPSQRHGEQQLCLLLHAGISRPASRLPVMQLCSSMSCRAAPDTCICIAPARCDVRRRSVGGMVSLCTSRPATHCTQEVCTLAAVADQVSAPSPPAASGNVVLEVKDLEVQWSRL